MSRGRAGWARLLPAVEMAPGLAVVALVALLFVPVEPAVVDLLVATSLGISATILLSVLLAPDSLRLQAFPALLLLTTLLRLVIAVASTRLVLARGDAGRIIEALGRVVMQGSWVAGTVVYAILALVQLLVVSRGAERVAEVAARFTLDALPGKQMAIDAELRAGAIDAAEAGRRRRTLEQESQLHGAMDGALKFVKGDAIAGIAIALVNALGGTVSGVLRGVPGGDAARRALLLAVGDGLASQVPALLLAVAAGIAVTRVSGEERSVSSRVARELASEPRALLASGFLLVALAIAPGLPAAPFLLLGAGLLVAGRRAGRAPLATAEEPGAAHPDGALAPVEAATVELSPDLLQGREDADAWLRDAGAALRADLWTTMGVPVLRVSVAASASLAALPGGWKLLVDGAPAAEGSVPRDHALCRAPAEELRLAGLAASPARDPLSGLPAASIAVADTGRAAALGAVLDPSTRALAEAHGALRRRAHLLVGVQEVQALLDALEPSAPALVREVSRQISPTVIAATLRQLLEEEISIRPLRPILEALVAAPAGTPPAALGDACRRSLSRHIAAPLLRGRRLEALLLDPGAEVEFRDALQSRVSPDPGRARMLIASVEAVLAAEPGARAILAPGDVRRPLRELVAPRFPDLAVLAYEELPPDLEVRPVGRAAFCE